MRIEVYVEKGGISVRVGSIATAPGAGESFSYDETWLASPGARPLSASLPLRSEPFPAKKMRPYFDGLLPEGGARSAIASRLHVSYAAYVKLLNAVGRECIGAVSLQGPSRTSEDGYSPVGEEAFVRLSSQSYPTAAEMSERARFSLAGSQAKIALYRSSDGRWFEPSGLAPSTHILKPAGARYPDSAINECLCMLAARRLGLDVPKVELMNIGGPIICTERFDRDLSSSVREIDGLPVPARLHQEDSCQALGIVPERKYEEGGVSYLDKLVGLIDSVSTDPIEDLWKLWDMVVFNYLIGNCDAHLKNCALLRDFTWRELRISPAYDLVCTSIYGGLSRRMAMSVGHAYVLDDVSVKAFEDQAKKIGLLSGRAMARVEDLARSVVSAIDQSALEMKEGGVRCEELADRIIAEVRENIARL